MPSPILIREGLEEDESLYSVAGLVLSCSVVRKPLLLRIKPRSFTTGRAELGTGKPHNNLHTWNIYGYRMIVWVADPRRRPRERGSASIYGQTSSVVPTRFSI